MSLPPASPARLSPEPWRASLSGPTLTRAVAGQLLESSERGIALLIVVSLLTVIGILGVAFAFSMRLETQAAQQFVTTVQARYLAEAGVNHARALLDEDRLGSRIDDLSEPWGHEVQGSDVDVDESGARHAVWWLVADANHRTIGRYALKIIDEAGKVNLNAAQADPSPSGVGAVNLTTILKQIGLDEARAHAAAQAIEQYRYGEDKRPGKAGVDDNGDGTIDEPAEYQPLALRGDDRRIEGVEEVGAIAALTPDELHRLSQVATVYSWDANMSVAGKARVNVNTATANELLAVLLDAGVNDPWQAAVNMADYVDPDFEMSRITKSSQLVALSHQGPMGSWTWSDDPQGHYESAMAGGADLAWSVSVPTGTFRVLARGLSGMKVGDVTVAGQQKPSVNDGESLGTFSLSGTLEVRVANHEATKTSCAFRGIELVSEEAKEGTVIRGIEAIRVNELMVDPTMELDVSTATFEPSGLGWACPADAGVCSNSGVGSATWTWTNPLLRLGDSSLRRYYVRVYGTAAGQTVGDVRIEGTTQHLVHGQRHPVTAVVGSDGKISVTIGKTSSEGTYYLKKLTVSLQPDAEYLELINLSDRDIDVSGWMIEGELTGGRLAKLPAGSVILAHGLLVAAVDLEDTQTTLAGNGIDARSAWGIPHDANAVQLEFPSGAPSPDDDWLKLTVPSGGPRRLIVRTKSGVVVDEVQYLTPLPTTSSFQSLEKGDPTVVVDANTDGVDDGWYPSLKLFTPGMPNDNAGLKEQRGLETMVHDPSKDITIPSRPLGGVGELAGLPSGELWKRFSSADLAKIVDRLTVEGLRLEVAGHLMAGNDAWDEKTGGSCVHTDPAKASIAGRWQWNDIPDGRYRLSLAGCSDCAGEELSVRWQQKDGTFTDWSPALSSDAQGRIAIGQITIGMDGTSPNMLTLEATCASAGGVCHMKTVRLDPQLLRIGPVNVNTASQDVLLSLPGMTQVRVARIMAGRPYGDQDHKARGIGDLLMGTVLGEDEQSKLELFRQVAHLLTVRSDVFQIISLGQSLLDNDHVGATQRIQTVVQR